MLPKTTQLTEKKQQKNKKKKTKKKKQHFLLGIDWFRYDIYW